MTWGTELWDQLDYISSHTQKGIEFCERLSHFSKERCAIETDYAFKLKKLVKNYQPKKKDDADCDSTCTAGFLSMIQEISNIASQHEVIADMLATKVINEIQSLVSELKQERKKQLLDAEKEQVNLKAQYSHLEKVKAKYEKSCKEALAAERAHDKAEADLSLSRIQIEKAKLTAQSKQQESETHKAEYTADLQKTNSHHKVHYEQTMPTIFNSLQALDERRIKGVSVFITSSSELEQSVMPHINLCLDNISKASDSINHKQDTQMVAIQIKTGKSPPQAIPFEEISTEIEKTQTKPSNPVSKIQTLHGAISEGNKKILGLVGGLLSSSKPQAQPHQESSTWHTDGRSDKTTSDTTLHITAPPGSKSKWKQPVAVPSTGSKQMKPTSLRDIQMKPLPPKPKSKNLMALIGKFSQNDNTSTKRPALESSDDDDSFDDSDDEGDESQLHCKALNSFNGTNEEGPALTAVKLICKALYTFDGTNAGELAITAGENINVLEYDQGNGWTWAQKPSTGITGIVPTTFLDLPVGGNT